MIDFKVQGAIFDVDDTLLDNNPGKTGRGLHERSRLMAVHAVGKQRSIPQLQQFSVQQNIDAFLTAPAHTVEAAVWNIFMMTGLADSDVINPHNELLLEIIALRNSLHQEMLREHGVEVPGAISFVKALQQGGLEGRLAIASTAVRAEVDTFLEMSDLAKAFPSERIKTKESITHPKPNPEVFNLAFASLGLPESARPNVCAFEDDPRGIMSAKAAGLYICAITTRFDANTLRSLEVPPDLVADSYQEFGELFGLELE